MTSSVKECLKHSMFPRSRHGGDISGAKLNPNKVVGARKVEISYADKKPVCNEIPRWLAKKMVG